MRLSHILLIAVFILTPGMASAALEQDANAWAAQQEASHPSQSVTADLARRHPDWPGIASLVAKLEARMDYNSLSPADVKAMFTQRRPRMPASIDAYMNALGDTPQARSELNAIWREEPLDTATQNTVLSRYASWLMNDAHIARIDMLLDRERLSQAGALAQRLGGEMQAWTLLRVAVLKGEIKSVAMLPGNYKRDPNILADFAKAAAKRDSVSEGASYLQQIGKPPPALAEELWDSRHRLAREALQRGQHQTAYGLAAGSGLQEGADFAAAEFLAGYIALKNLNNPRGALDHFMRMHANVTGAVSKSRAAYWAGRSAQALGDASQTQRWYMEASRYPTTYFGQEAYQALNRSLSRSAVDQAAGGTPALSAADSRLNAAKYFYRQGRTDYARQFLLAAMSSARSSADYKIVNQVAKQNNDRTAQVKLAREAGKLGYQADSGGYPRMTNSEVQRAQEAGMRNIPLVHAIIRQESEFDAQALSSAGARGLMQLMPATARHVAQRNGLHHDASWLTGRPDHNVHLGSSYLASLLDRYSGSKVLAIAAYNAGPGRVSEWLGRFGDPRTNQIQTEDWIELIPIYETRNYIQRVLESEAVYGTLL